MSVGLAKIIEKVHISWYFDSPEADLHIVDNASCMIYTNTWLQKQVFDCQTAKVHIAVHPIMHVKTHWNSTLEGSSAPTF